MSGNERVVLVRVAGKVQGVGFRAFAKAEAQQLGLAGWVVNREDGSVEAALQGPGEALGDMISRLRRGPPSAQVESLDVRSVDPACVIEKPAHGIAF